MVRIMDRIDSPSDLKQLPVEQLPHLAQEYREEIIRVVSRSGGHLASSLGAIEIVLGLHRVFNAPHDKLVWDMGYQAYAHKLITGRRRQFHTMRQFGGLSGFVNKDESVYDLFTTGHGGTALSYALGMAVARDAVGSDEKVVAIIGDAALGEGMALEALNHGGHVTTDLVVILNDNKMSISPPVGALSKYLNRVLTNPLYNKVHHDMAALIKRVPRFGFRAFRAAKKLEASLKGLLVPGLVFEELGFRYFGPIDGNDIRQVISTLEKVKELKGPSIIHMVTKKGKGYPFAEQLPEKFHRTTPFDIPTGQQAKGETGAKSGSFSEAFSDTLIRLSEQDGRIVAINAAMPEGTGLSKFAKRFPNRCFDVGMAEQHAVGFAAGMARRGLIPVVAIYSTFMQRAYDQIMHDVCLQDVHVILALDRAGYVGDDGQSHHGVFDVAYLRCLPGIVIMAPKDATEMEQMTEFAVRYRGGPVALRYPRGGTVGKADVQAIRWLDAPIQLGKGQLLRDGSDLAIVALGSMVYPALEAASILSQDGIEASVANARFVKPFDVDLIGQLAAKVGRVVVIEEAGIDGGFGDGVIAYLEETKTNGLQALRIAMPTQFVEHGTRDQLLDMTGLTGPAIARRIRDWMVSKAVKTPSVEASR